MNTPCETAPEAWVGDDPNLRLQAMHECLGCWKFVACDAEAKANKPSHGVWAGVDYSKKPKKIGRPKGKQPPSTLSRDCEHCGERFYKGKLSQSQWGKRKFCGLDCAYAAARRAA